MGSSPTFGTDRKRTGALIQCEQKRLAEGLVVAKRKSRLSKKTLDRFERAKKAKKKMDAGGERFVKTSDAIAFVQSMDDALQSVLDDVLDGIEALGVERSDVQRALSPVRQDLRKVFDEATADMKKTAFSPEDAN